MKRNNSIQVTRVELEDNFKKTQREPSSLTIYFDKEKKSRQVIRPYYTFNGDYLALVLGITGGRYDHYDIN